MIYDSIKHLESYAGLSDDIRRGLVYLRKLKADAEVGVFVLSPRVKAIISEYMTKDGNEFGYESHRQHIDIQYLIKGKEKVCCLPLDYLKEIKPYSEEEDVVFFEAADMKPQELVIGNGRFSIFFPQDGHMPQLSVDKPELVKKVVIKVRIEE